jgi:hypothetical protein
VPLTQGVEVDIAVTVQVGVEVLVAVSTGDVGDGDMVFVWVTVGERVELGDCEAVAVLEPVVERVGVMV